MSKTEIETIAPESTRRHRWSAPSTFLADDCLNGVEQIAFVKPAEW